MWYPEKQADFQSSASIHVKHIALGISQKSSPKDAGAKGQKLTILCHHNEAFFVGQ